MESKTRVVDVSMTPVTLPRAPTSWYWNVRQGDKIRFGDSSQAWTIVGPMLVGPYLAQNQNNSALSATEQQTSNPERYINWGSPGSFNSVPSANPYDKKEFLIVLDGMDNDGDGYIDEAFDGIDNDGDGITDPGFDGIDNNGNGFVDEPIELLYQQRRRVRNRVDAARVAPRRDLEVGDTTNYTILRRPVPASGARELTLPPNVVIDMTTWTRPRERSRLPVDLATGYVEIMFAPNGQLVQPLAGPTEPVPPTIPFFHFWITDTEDVYEANNQQANNVPYLLPLPKGTTLYPDPGDANPRFLENNRRLITLNTKTGQVTTTTLENFSLADAKSNQPNYNPAALDRPYLQAEAGIREEP